MVGFIHPQHPVATVLGRATALASQFIRVRVNGDLALFRGLAKALLEKEAAHPGTVVDAAFLRDHTAGYEAYRTLVREDPVAGNHPHERGGGG